MPFAFNVCLHFFLLGVVRAGESRWKADEENRTASLVRGEFARFLRKRDRRTTTRRSDLVISGIQASLDTILGETGRDEVQEVRRSTWRVAWKLSGEEIRNDSDRFSLPCKHIYPSNRTPGLAYPRS